MADYTKLLQIKVDKAHAKLAEFESTMSDLEHAKEAGLLKRGDGARMLRLQGRIKGARLALTNAEKKLKGALPEQASIDPQPSTVIPGSDVPIDIGAQDDLLLSKNSDISMDTAGTDNVTSQPPLIHQDNRLAVMSPDVSQPGDMIVDDTACSQQPILPNVSTEQTPNLLVQPSSTIIEAVISQPQNLLAKGADKLVVQPSSIINDNEVLPDPEIDDVTANRQSNTTLSKRTERGEHQNDEELLGEVVGLSLITLEDKAELQQHLFKTRFTKGPPPKKSQGLSETKYVDVSSSDAEGDDGIFVDDEAEPTGVTGLTLPSNPIPTAGAQPKSVLPSNSRQQPEEGISKGKGHAENVKSQKRKVPATSKTKAEKLLISGGRNAEPMGMSGKGKDSDIEGMDHGEYRASDYSMAKADREMKELEKLRVRYSDKGAHRLLAEKWLNATEEERPEFPTSMMLVRRDAKYLPDLVTADYDLALQLLMNKSKNYLCIPHTLLDCKIVAPIDNLEGPVRILGIPLARNQNRNASSNIPCVPNHLHCGCHEKVALASFVMWKTWKAQWMIGNKMVIEGLHQQKPFSPREVLFFLQFLKKKFGFTVKDMFMGSLDEEEDPMKEGDMLEKTAIHCALRRYHKTGKKMTFNIDYSQVLEEDFDQEWI